MKRTLLHILMHNGRLLQRVVDEELALTGLHHGQGRMLKVIDRNGEMTQAALARRMDIKPATVTNMLKPLETRGFITRRLDPQTNRAMVVSLTLAGERAVAEVEGAWARIEKKLANDFTETELAGLFQGLEKVRNTLGGEGPEELENSPRPQDK